MPRPHQSAAPPPQPLFYTLREFQAAGGPGRVKCYELHKLGLLNLVKDAAGRTGVTAIEADRYFDACCPLDGARRDTSIGVAAHKRAAAFRRVA